MKLLLLNIFVILPLIQSTFIDSEYQDIPPYILREAPVPKRTPVEIMVDITNDLSYRILQLHSIVNRNNVAFSPTSLASVLIALYEGSQGSGATEIYNVLSLPWDRDVIRIGYRDIHRRLRKYFFNEENPLTGLSLNKENVTITSEYEDLLKFYGYDLESDMRPFNEGSHKPTQPPSSSTSTTELTTTTSESTTSSSTAATESTTLTTESSSSTSEATTNPSSAGTTPMQDESSTTPSEATEPSSTATESTTMNNQETTTISSDTTTLDQETTETEPPTTTMVITTRKPAKLISTIDPANVIFPLKRLKRPSANRKVEREGRPKRQLPLTFDDQTFTITVTPIQPPISNFNFVTLGSNDDDINRFYYQPKTAVLNKKEIYHVFYLNTQETVQARYKVYNSILRFNYIPAIRSSVLELELDSKDYDLLIMIPDYGFGVEYLLQTLNLAPTLRAIREEMKPRWVQAIVPDFKLKGNIFLTSDLQNLCIREIFEPTRADFSPMSNDSDIYVKHIEQSINLHIRTRPLDQLKRNTGPFIRPIDISVNHPFVFFIVDKELDVAIMTGRVLNPLNVRIH